MINRQNMLIIEKDGNNLGLLSSIMANKFKVVTTFSFSKAQSFIDSERASILLSDARNCDQSNLTYLEQFVEANPYNPVIIIASSKAQDLLKKKIGVKANLFFADNPIDKAKLVKICLESFDKITNSDDKKEVKQETIPLTSQLTPFLFRSINRKPLQSHGISVEPQLLTIVSEEDLNLGTNLLLVIKGKGIALKVEKILQKPEQPGALTYSLAADKKVNLLDLFMLEGLISKSNEEKKTVPPPERGNDFSIITGTSIPAILPNSILYVDDDEYIKQTIENILKENEIKISKGFLDPELAWHELSKNHYDLILLDWIMPKISGSTFLCRLRHDPFYQNVPVLIISGMAAKNDFTVLADFPFVKLLEKPFAPVDLLKNITHLAQRSKQWKILVKNCEKLITEEKWSRDEDVTMEKLTQFLSQPPDIPYHFFVAAEVFAQHGILKTSEELYKKAASSSQHQAKALFQLGKMYLNNGMIQEAKVTLAKGYKLSPSNSCRLLDMGRLYMNELDLETAQKIFVEVRKNDPDNPTANQALLLSKNISNWLLLGNTSAQSFAGALNSVGIAFIHDNKMKDGINHYKEAIAFITDPVAKSRLAFNLALAYKKANHLDDCLHWLEKAISFDPDFDKPRRHIEIINGLKNLSPQEKNNNDKKITPSYSELKKDNSNKLGESKNLVSEEKIKLLYKASPDLANYFRALTEARINVDRSLPRFIFFYDKYGDKNFAAAIRKALSEKIYSIEYLAEILRHKKYSNKENEIENLNVKSILFLDSENELNNALKIELEKTVDKIFIEPDTEKATTLFQEQKLSRPQLIVVPDTLRGNDAIKTVYHLKNDSFFSESPVIFLVDSIDPKRMAQAASVGVEEFCLRTQGNQAIIEKIKSFLGE